MGQHPPVIAPGLRRVQAATQLLSDGDRDAEGVGSNQCGDVTGRVQKRRVNTLRILQRQSEAERETEREVEGDTNCAVAFFQAAGGMNII